MTTPPWDFEHQRAETLYTFDQILAAGEIARNAQIDLDLHFSGTGAADPQAAIRALAMFGYTAQIGAEAHLLEAGIQGIRFDADEIWLHEERTTRILLSRGYTPEGWGFWEPED